MDPVIYLSQWFCDAPFDVIRHGNVAEMLTYGFFYKRRWVMGLNEKGVGGDSSLKEGRRVVARGLRC
jgi:hypothetical protein